MERVAGKQVFVKVDWPYGKGLTYKIGCEPIYNLFGLELRKQDNVTDTFLSEKHHAQTIDAEAHSPGGRHPVFERDKEIIIEFLFFASGLMFEAVALLDRIILFSIGGGDFLAVDTAFKDFDRFRIVRGKLGQRNELLGSMGDEGRVEQSWFDEFFEHGLTHFEILVFFGNFGTEAKGTLAAGFRCDFEPVGAGPFPEQIFIANSTPGRGQIDRFGDLAG